MKKIIFISCFVVLGLVGLKSQVIFDVNGHQILQKSDDFTVYDIGEKSVSENAKPNIVFYLLDDLGWSDVGYNGSVLYDTPIIDQLAKDGVRFNQAYAASHVCSPSRASLLTGKNPASIDLTDWLPGRREYPFQKLSNADVNPHLPFEEITLAEVLRNNGYITGMYGKWHLGEDPSGPLEHGFDVRVPTDWNRGWPRAGFYYPFEMEGLEGEEGDYLTDVLTDEALKFIDDNKDRPFFLYLSHFAVHDPIQGPPALVEKYEQRIKERTPQGGLPYILEGNPDTEEEFTREELDELLTKDEYQGYRLFQNRLVKIKQHQDNAHFAAMVENMDENLGRVISKLEELGIKDNTIIIFYSDNGGMSGANFANPLNFVRPNQEDRRFSTSNLPLRGAKGWLYEGGIKVPMIIKWPHHVNATVSETDVPVNTYDFYPTILEMLGYQVPEEQKVDGMSLVPLMLGQAEKTTALEERALYWHFPQYSNHGQQSPGGAIRYKGYKLIEYFENFQVQLFNLKTDPYELIDLSDSNPEKVEELRSKLHSWRQEVDARMPLPNPDYDPIFENGWHKWEQ